MPKPPFAVIVAIVVVACVFPAGASAQDQGSHWGVSGTVVPLWKVPTALGQVMKADQIDFTGSELRVGVARGRDLGGDWGVSFVRKTVKDGSRVVQHKENAPGNNFYLTQGVALTGVEAYKFVPFTTIRQRVQIGMNFGGGVATFRGSVESHEQKQSFTFDPATQRGTVTYREVVEMHDISKEVDIKVLPLARVEAAVAVLVAPGLKVRGTGGFNFPGYQVASVSLVYLFGAR
ncbi:MAG: hypothetical protein HYS05_13750 [Acidobacteria bacterium]|nr:hypothetical protein [Acidobacteriota bacterium]